MTNKVVLAQMQLAFGKMNANLEKVKEIAAGLSAGTILLLPELWSSSYDLENTASIARENRLVISEIRKLARSHGIYIGGSLLEEIDSQVYNAFSLIGPDGETAASYQKIHLFRLMEEEKWMTPGNHLELFGFEEGKAGLAICYDLRFPELFRKYALSGCKMVLLVAEWPLERISHWRILLQARAIENQMFIAAVNCTGLTGNTQFGGNSMIIDPWGNIISEAAGDQAQIVAGEVDLKTVAEVRTKIPVFEDRRPELYYG